MSDPFERWLSKGQGFVDPDLVDATIKVESSGNPNAVSDKGAQGLMQLMPTTAKMLGVTDPKDPKQNKEGGTKYLAYLMDKFKDYGADAERMALAAYDRGETYMSHHTLAEVPGETKNHGDRIEREKEKLKSRPDSPTALTTRMPPKTSQSTAAPAEDVNHVDQWLNSGGMGVPDYTVGKNPFEEFMKVPPAEHMAASLGQVAKDVGKGALSNAESLTRGAVAAIPGVWGDAEQLGRKGINALGRAVQKTGVGKENFKNIMSEKTVLPTTEEVRGMLPDRMTDARQETKGMEELGSELNFPGMEIGLKAPGQVLRFVKPALGEALDSYHTALGGKSHILAPPTASEKAKFASLKSAGATPEEIWRAYQMVEDQDGHLFTRIDDSKAKWKGEEALRAKVPARAKDYDEKLAALKAKVAEKPDAPLESPEYKKWKDDVEDLAYERDKAKGLLYSESSTRGLTMKDVLDHPELYKRHPELKDINIQIGPRAELKGANGEHDFANNRIRLSDQTWQSQIAGTLKPDRAEGITIHELQHAIDRRRADAGEVNMDVGANPDEIFDERNKTAKENEKDLTLAEDETTHSQLALDIGREMEKGRSHDDAIKEIARQYRVPKTYEPLLEAARRAKTSTVQELELADQKAQEDWLHWHTITKPVTKAEAFKLYQADPGEVRARVATEGLRIKNADAPFPMSTGEKGAFDLPQSSWVKRDATWRTDPDKVSKPRPALSVAEPPPVPMQEALGKEGTTLKTLERLPMSKGMLNVQTVRDALKRADVSKAERDVLEPLLPESGTVKASDLISNFRKATKDFELTPHHHEEYADYGLNNIHRHNNYPARVANAEYFRDPADETPVRTTTWQVGDGVSGSTGNHFGDPRYFAHTRAFEEDGIPHVVEMQSDLMQKNAKPMSAEERTRLKEDNEKVIEQLDALDKHFDLSVRATTEDYERMVSVIEKANPDFKLRVGADLIDKVPGLRHVVQGDEEKAFDWILNKGMQGDKSMTQQLDASLSRFQTYLDVQRSENNVKLAEGGPVKDLTPLKKTHVERLVKEELNMAAKKGQDRVRFAAPDTVAKVEGWKDHRRGLQLDISKRKQEISELKTLAANHIKQGRTASATRVNENIEDLQERLNIAEKGLANYHNARIQEAKESIEKAKEGLEISERIFKSNGDSESSVAKKIERWKKSIKESEHAIEYHTAHLKDGPDAPLLSPKHGGIYDNYKEIEKYLKSIGGTEYTDKHGHKWIEVKPKGEKSPVKDGRVPLFSMAGGPALAGGGAAGYNANNSGKKDK